MQGFKENFRKYKLYYISEGVFLISWLIYFVLFFQLYQEASFYVDQGAKYIIQLLFLVEYYFNSLFIYFIMSFLLLVANLYSILLYSIKMKQEKKKIQFKFSMQVFMGLYILCAGALLLTKLWVLFLLLIILAVTVVYITYAMTKSQKDNDTVYEENEVVKQLGSFSTAEEAQSRAQEFATYWQEEFQENGYTLVSDIYNEKENEYTVDIYVKSIEKDKD
ncbi:hypothetical protein A5821_002034 [Enterococcus sp. 7F3_DIV0205]|uniref:Uncharacterized protein n=1 Tax=Candidatus Enterococcus palustris TaxID=1834189 RepID=A0AAQ3WCT6_9ENTE|nr:hypothetical protein [Enterococcus sp. 7F3_DIV0205]OTN82473.1 hypothetical protein A5821_002384 [Enterococcus sp. 7F3_DIV0205]